MSVFQWCVFYRLQFVFERTATSRYLAMIEKISVLDRISLPESILRLLFSLRYWSLQPGLMCTTGTRLHHLPPLCRMWSTRLFVSTSRLWSRVLQTCRHVSCCLHLLLLAPGVTEVHSEVNFWYPVYASVTASTCGLLVVWICVHVQLIWIGLAGITVQRTRSHSVDHRLQTK